MHTIEREALKHSPKLAKGMTLDQKKEFALYLFYKYILDWGDEPNHYAFSCDRVKAESIIRDVD